MQGPQAASATFLRSCNSSKSAPWCISSHLVGQILTTTLICFHVPAKIMEPDQSYITSHLRASSQAFSTVLRSLVVIFCLTLRPSMVLFMLKQYLKLIIWQRWLTVWSLRFQLISCSHSFSLGVIVSFELLGIVHLDTNVISRY